MEWSRRRYQQLKATSQGEWTAATDSTVQRMQTRERRCSDSSASASAWAFVCGSSGRSPSLHRWAFFAMYCIYVSMCSAQRTVSRQHIVEGYPKKPFQRRQTRSADGMGLSAYCPRTRQPASKIRSGPIPPPSFIKGANGASGNCKSRLPDPIPERRARPLSLAATGRHGSDSGPVIALRCRWEVRRAGYSEALVMTTRLQVIPWPRSQWIASRHLCTHGDVHAVAVAGSRAESALNSPSFRVAFHGQLVNCGCCSFGVNRCR